MRTDLCTVCIGGDRMRSTYYPGVRSTQVCTEQVILYLSSSDILIGLHNFCITKDTLQRKHKR